MHAWHARPRSVPAPSLSVTNQLETARFQHRASRLLQPHCCIETEHPRGRERGGKWERKKKKKQPQSCCYHSRRSCREQTPCLYRGHSRGELGTSSPGPPCPAPAGARRGGSGGGPVPGSRSPSTAGVRAAEGRGAAPSPTWRRRSRGSSSTHPRPDTAPSRPPHYGRPSTAAPSRAEPGQAEPGRAGRLSPHRAPHGSRSPRRFLIHPGPGGAGAAEQRERPPYTHTRTPAGASTGTHPPARSRVPGAVPGSELSERRRRAGSDRRLPAATARARRSPPRAPPTGRALTCGPPHPGGAEKGDRGAALACLRPQSRPRSRSPPSCRTGDAPALAVSPSTAPLGQKLWCRARAAGAGSGLRRGGDFIMFILGPDVELRLGLRSWSSAAERLLCASALWGAAFKLPHRLAAPLPLPGSYLK